MTRVPKLPFTSARLKSDFEALGVRAGQTVMLHASVHSVGAVMGGPDVILLALLDALAPGGTLMMYAGWQDIPDFLDELPASARQLYHDQHPPFDPAMARAVRENSILAEFLRTLPGTQRSLNPEASMIANGAQAVWLTQDHPLNYGYGAGSPLEKLVLAGGKVLLLGSPLDNITLLHYAEYRARLRHKQVVHYQCPILREGVKVWVDIEDFETGDTHDDYSFEQIAQAYLAKVRVKPGIVGNAESFLFDAAHLTAFAIEWLEHNFGG